MSPIQGRFVVARMVWMAFSPSNRSSFTPSCLLASASCASVSGELAGLLGEA